jgi:hypothetical protein
LVKIDLRIGGRTKNPMRVKRAKKITSPRKIFFRCGLTLFRKNPNNFFTIDLPPEARVIPRIALTTILPNRI